jgi:hypothetical protein
MTPTGVTAPPAGESTAITMMSAYIGNLCSIHYTPKAKVVLQ